MKWGLSPPRVGASRALPAVVSCSCTPTRAPLGRAVVHPPPASVPRWHSDWGSLMILDLFSYCRTHLGRTLSWDLGTWHQKSLNSSLVIGIFQSVFQTVTDVLSPRQERYGWMLPGTSLSRGSEDEKPWVQKWPCFITATSLKISRKHLKQTNKAAAQHISHSSPSLTSPGIVKLGQENQQKVFYTVNRGEKVMHLLCKAELESRSFSSYQECQGRRQLLVLQVLMASSPCLVSATAGSTQRWCWSAGAICRGSPTGECRAAMALGLGLGQHERAAAPPSFSGWQNTGGRCGFSARKSGVTLGSFSHAKLVPDFRQHWF